MSLLKKYHEEIRYNLEQSKEKIINKINKGKVNQKAL